MSIPTLDLHLAENDRGEAARQLVAALEEPGFVYLQNVEGYHPGNTQNHDSTNRGAYCYGTPSFSSLED